MSVLALIPARAGSKGIPVKNFRELGGRPLWMRAVDCARAADVETTVISSDKFTCVSGRSRGYEFVWDADEARWKDKPGKDWHIIHLPRPVELAQDDTPMIAVVQHALQQIPGQPDDIIVLLQPTQPLRRPEHVQQAIALLQESGADSVVSVVALPLTHRPEFVLRVYEPTGELEPYCDEFVTLGDLPTRRQGGPSRYIRDGTVYAFWRKTVAQHGNIYGQDVRPLIIDPADSCELDTEADWIALEQRWTARHAPEKP